MTPSAGTAAASSNDGPTTLQVGDLVVTIDRIWGESQGFLRFTRISLPKGAVFKVSDVSHSSGDFILNLANVFDDDVFRQISARCIGRIAIS